MSGRILIVDDVAGSRIVLRARLAEACYDTVMAADGAECLAIAQTVGDGRPDMILLGLDLPDMTGAAVLRRLRADPRSRTIPVIGLDGGQDRGGQDCGSQDWGGQDRGGKDWGGKDWGGQDWRGKDWRGQDWGGRIAALAAGADDVFAKSAPDALLLARVRNLLRARVELAAVPGLAEPAGEFEPSGVIGLVSSCPDRAGCLCEGLRRHLRDRIVVMSQAQAMDAATAGAMDVFVIDAVSGKGAVTALGLLSDLKSRQATRHAAVCLTGLPAPDDRAAMAYDLGADDVVSPLADALELSVRLRSLLRRKHSRDRQRVSLADGLRLALIDPLTGLYNRRHAVPELRAIAARARETGTGFSVMVVDLDRFKAVNDQHGHAVGDAVLVEVARRLRSNLRDGDLLARIGGEEFLIALPGIPDQEGRLVAQRLCEAIEEAPVLTGSGLGVTVTVSIGVAGSLPDAPVFAGIDAVVEAADQALLEAKAAGRNQVTLGQSAA